MGVKYNGTLSAYVLCILFCDALTFYKNAPLPDYFCPEIHIIQCRLKLSH